MTDSLTPRLNTVLVISSLLLCVSAIAQSSDQTFAAPPTFSPSPSQTFYLDLDAPPGALQWRHDSLGPLDALKVRLRVPRIRKDGKWMPSFVLYVQGNDDPELADATWPANIYHGRQVPHADADCWLPTWQANPRDSPPDDAPRQRGAESGNDVGVATGDHVPDRNNGISDY